ncbi:hypothetical protein OLMES_5243 [Oleiphilus messinensis]|uniref:Uncharacterized protein n=1 Tax=Oleiphilus messinensis TaxID=141451 RepID=A0A1Y0IFA9_9GAMM|nr:hypothetical protein [Oleiphilus messinensis]ARU59227.1 hypothetical protein OLMES_5243 [Oleiphilus messinensis]
MITPVEENAWHRAKMQSLTESDFSLVIDLETAEMNANFHPDFSGAEMQFGYVTGWRHSGNAAVLIDNRVDNLRISISHDAAAESTLNLVKTLATEAQSAYGVAYAEMTNTLWLQDHENDQLIQVTPEGAVLSSIELPSSSVSSHLDISVAPEALQLGRAEIDAGSILVFEGEGGITIMYGFDPVTGNQVSRQTTSFGEGFVVGGAYHPERGSFFLLQNNEAVSSDANVIAEISASDGSILNRIALASVATDFDVVSGDLEVGSNGNLYVLSSAEAAMLELTLTGSLVQEIALPVTNVAFSGLALDTEAGDVWTINTAGILQRFTDGQSTPGATESVAFLGAGNLYTSQADTMVYGNAEQETLLVSCNPTITVDANVERIELPGALADYQFSVQGTRIQITSTEAGTLSFLGLNQPVELVFADGAASLQLSGLSIATLNTQFLSSFAATITTGLDAADVSKTASSEGCEN